MRQFWVSFALTSIILSITALVAVVSVRQWSLNRSFEPPLESPLIELRGSGNAVRIISYMGDGKAAPGSIAALQSAAELGPKTWIWLDLRPTIDDSWVALSEVYLENATNLQGLTGLKAWTELQSAQLKRLDGQISVGNEERVARLDEIAKALPNQTLVLNFKEYRPGDDIKIEKLLRDLGLTNRAVVLSDIQGLLNDIRTLNAKLVFGAGLAQIAKLRALLAMGLEGLLAVKGDIVLATSIPDHVVADLIAESHRRKRPVYLGAPGRATIEQELNWVQSGADGIITGSPRQLCRALRQRQIESCAISRE